MFNYQQAKNELREWLIEYTGCGIQTNVNDKEWPCDTCVIDLLDNLGLNPNQKEYHERNGEPDRANEVWRAILQIRDAD